MSYETNVGTVRKQPSEITDVIGVGFGSHLGVGESITTCQFTVTDEVGADVTTAMLHISSWTTAEAQFRIKAGTNGQRYLVTIVATLSNASVIEREVTILVMENQYASSELSFTVGEVITKVTEALGTKVETGNMTQNDKISAIYGAYHDILTSRKPEEAMEGDWTLYFSEQKASLPPGYLIWIKFIEVDQPTVEYKKVGVNEFDGLDGFYWTIKKDDYGSQKIFVARVIASAKIRYIASPTEFSTVNDVIYLPRYYLYPIALDASARILSNARDYAGAAAKKAEAASYLQSSGAIHAEQQRSASQARLKSMYDGESLFDEEL